MSSKFILHYNFTYRRSENRRSGTEVCGFNWAGKKYLVQNIPFGFILSHNDSTLIYWIIWLEVNRRHKGCTSRIVLSVHTLD